MMKPGLPQSLIPLVLLCAAPQAFGTAEPLSCLDNSVVASAVRTPEDVQAFVQCAYEFVQEVGFEEARRAFNEDECWKSGPIYIFVDEVSPLETIFRISDCCCGENLGRRPPTRPFCRAASSPAWVRSRSMARSNSAKAPTICIIIRPAGVVVSIASVRLRNPATASPRRSHDHEHVAQRTRQPVQLPNHDDVPRAQLIQQLVQLGPVPTSTGCHLAKDALTSGLFQRRHLSGGVLIIRGDASVTDQHCINISPIESIVQHCFATPKPLKTRPAAEGCTTAPLCKPVS